MSLEWKTILLKTCFRTTNPKCKHVGLELRADTLSLWSTNPQNSPGKETTIIIIWIQYKRILSSQEDMLQWPSTLSWKCLWQVLVWGCLVTRPILCHSASLPANKKRLAVVKWQEQCPYQLDLETPNISMSLINPARKKSWCTISLSLCLFYGCLAPQSSRLALSLSL